MNLLEDCIKCFWAPGSRVAEAGRKLGLNPLAGLRGTQRKDHCRLSQAD